MLRTHKVTRGFSTEGPEKFSHPQSRNKISNLMSCFIHTSLILTEVLFIQGVSGVYTFWFLGTDYLTMALRARNVFGAFEKRASAPSIVCLIAQFVEHCTGIAEVMGLNPVKAWICFGLLFHNCLSCLFNVTAIIDHVFMFFSAVQIYDLSNILLNISNVLDWQFLSKHVIYFI